VAPKTAAGPVDACVSGLAVQVPDTPLVEGSGSTEFAVLQLKALEAQRPLHLPSKPYFLR
jgi:hypothetical protein